MTFDQFEKILSARGMFRIRPRLDSIEKVLHVLGEPQSRMPVIHIAGTNGKGSVAAALESVLRNCGYKTGLYTSPHLRDLRERIQINGKPFVQGFTDMARIVLRAEKSAQNSLTYFELLTAIAYKTFAARQVDIAVVECGLGGKWDATNAVRTPILSIITSVGLDHMEWLGKTERQIAAQKAGIAKAGGCLISGARAPGQAVIARIARKTGSKLVQIDLDYRAESLTSSWNAGKQMIRFLYNGEPPEIVPFGLLGTHQIDNCAVVLAALRELKRKGWKIPQGKRDLGLRNVKWPGRMQRISVGHSALIILDGAHNPAAMEKLVHSIQQSTYKNSPKTFVFSAFKDKDTEAMGKIISPLASEVCLCRLDGPRAATISRLRRGLNVKGPVREFKDAGSALQGAMQDTPRGGLIVVCGSLRLVGLASAFIPTLRSRIPLHV